LGLFRRGAVARLFWAVFVLLGIEKLHIVPGITEANPLRSLLQSL
jgi:hypothetical protein